MQTKVSEIKKCNVILCISSSPHSHISRHIVTFPSLFLSLPLSCYLSHTPCYSSSKPIPAFLVPFPHAILVLTHYELLALMYSQYSLYHISMAAVCQGSDRKRTGEKKRERERM